MAAVTAFSADQFRQDVRDYLRFMCNSATEARAVDDFCQESGGYGRIMAFLDASGIGATDAAHLSRCSDRARRAFDEMKRIAVEKYKMNLEI